MKVLLQLMARQQTPAWVVGRFSTEMMINIVSITAISRFPGHCDEGGRSLIGFSASLVLCSGLSYNCSLQRQVLRAG